jgi:hypothetical protein
MPLKFFSPNNSVAKSMGRRQTVAPAEDLIMPYTSQRSGGVPFGQALPSPTARDTPLGSQTAGTTKQRPSPSTPPPLHIVRMEPHVLLGRAVHLRPPLDRTPTYPLLCPTSVNPPSLFLLKGSAQPLFRTLFCPHRPIQERVGAGKGHRYPRRLPFLKPLRTHRRSH